MDLPSLLRKAIELSAYSQALKYYNSTAEILRRYINDLPSFKPIQAECEHIIGDLKVTLNRKIVDPSVR